MTSVQFSGITFDDESYAGFHLSKLVGWYDAPTARFDADDRPQGDGKFRQKRVWRGARVVSVEGSWTGDNLAAAYAAREQLMAAQADGAESPFVVNDLLGVRSSSVSLTTAPTADDGLYQPFFKFAFDVIAPDPVKYGRAQSQTTSVPTPSSGLVWPLGSSTPYFNWGTPGSSGQISLTNSGTAQSWPTLTVTGGLAGGFSLTWVPTGDQLIYSGPIPDGSSVNLSARTGRATMNGTSDVTGFLTTSNWWSIAPGQTGLVQFTPIGVQSGTPSLTGAVAPGYL